MKHIHIEVTEEEFYRLVELKGKYKANCWDDLIWKLVDKIEEEFIG